MNKMRELKKLLGKERLAAGWTIEPTANGHWRLVSPAGTVVTCEGTASDGRAAKNTLARVRRAERRDRGEDVSDR